MKQTKEEYSALIKQDIEWLLEQPHCLERNHILKTLKKSIELYENRNKI